MIKDKGQNKFNRSNVEDTGDWEKMQRARTKEEVNRKDEVGGVKGLRKVCLSNN